MAAQFLSLFSCSSFPVITTTPLESAFQSPFYCIEDVGHRSLPSGDLAENATAYVSLEPCNHYGRTPPCREARVKAKVKKVVIGMIDPNPIVASRGVQRLRDAGMNAVVGVEEELCSRLNEAFIHKMLAGTPFVTHSGVSSLTASKSIRRRLKVDNLQHKISGHYTGGLSIEL